jgi:hypothetical protein
MEAPEFQLSWKLRRYLSQNHHLRWEGLSLFMLCTGKVEDESGMLRMVIIGNEKEVNCLVKLSTVKQIARRSVIQ